MNPKIMKLRGELEKNKCKISDLQGRTFGNMDGYADAEAISPAAELRHWFLPEIYIGYKLRRATKRRVSMRDSTNAPRDVGCSAIALGASAGSHQTDSEKTGKS